LSQTSLVTTEAGTEAFHTQLMAVLRLESVAVAPPAQEACLSQIVIEEETQTIEATYAKSFNLTLGQGWLKRTHLNLQQNSTCEYIKLFSQQYNEQVTNTRENGMRDTQTMNTKKQQCETKILH